MFSKFGRQIFSLYERKPVLMNSIVGGGVYVAGEYSVMVQNKDVRFFDESNWKKLFEIGALGSAENGLIMMKWYNLLNKYVGNSVGTPVVLLKCLLDQVFFATQQDLLFLGLCAHSDTEVLSDAIEEVKDNFLTTWITDCSVWPVVNFVGFAFVPCALQPTYMAVISFFWQLYMSAAAAAQDEGTTLTDADLELLFNELDTDHSKFIDADELKAFFKKRNIRVTHKEILQMIADADLMGREFHGEEADSKTGDCENVSEDDGLVSLEEFKRIALHGQEYHLKSTALWASVRQDIVLAKGAKHAIKRLENVQKQKEASRKSQESERCTVEHSDRNHSEVSGGSGSRPSGEISDTFTWFYDMVCYWSGGNNTISPSRTGISPHERATRNKAGTDEITPAVRTTATEVVVYNRSSTGSGGVDRSEKLTATREVEKAKEKAKEKEISSAAQRMDAVEKASIGTGILAVAVVLRLIIFKI